MINTIFSETINLTENVDPKYARDYYDIWISQLNQIKNQEFKEAALVDATIHEIRDK